MSDYEQIITAIMACNLDALEEFAQLLDDFPTGKDHFIQRHWITNGIDCGNAAVVSWMIEKGAPLIFQDDEGYSVLHSAIERNQPDKYEVLQILIAAGAELNAHGTNDWTPAHMAAARNDVEALKILKAAGADFSLRTRIDDYATPLEEAQSLEKSPEAVAYLLSQR